MDSIDVTDLDEVWIGRGNEKRSVDVSDVDGEFLAPPGCRVFAEEP